MSTIDHFIGCRWYWCPRCWIVNGPTGADVAAVKCSRCFATTREPVITPLDVLVTTFILGNYWAADALERNSRGLE